MGSSQRLEAAGFADPAYFTRTFSQEFGAAPSRFRG
ncbi:MAG: AraC family transcriptional regulator [Saprospiraceae bacterium]|nr:AraC family transcriptional regulator [Saprospiraceae bacterium]